MVVEAGGATLDVAVFVAVDTMTELYVVLTISRQLTAVGYSDGEVIGLASYSALNTTAEFCRAPMSLTWRGLTIAGTVPSEYRGVKLGGVGMVLVNEVIVVVISSSTVTVTLVGVAVVVSANGLVTTIRIDRYMKDYQ